MTGVSGFIEVSKSFIPHPDWAFNDDPAVGGGHNYAKPGQPAYASLLFYAYTGDGQWWYIGEDNRFELRGFVTLESMKNNIEFFHEFQPELPVWDIRWLKDTYGIEPRPLPERVEEYLARRENDPALRELAGEAIKTMRAQRDRYDDKYLKP